MLEAQEAVGQEEEAEGDEGDDAKDDVGRVAVDDDRGIARAAGVREAWVDVAARHGERVAGTLSVEVFFLYF